MKLFFHEPELFPSLGFFHGLLNSNAWVVVDHLQFKSRARENICRIKTATGIQMLRIPVRLPCNQPLHSTHISNITPWKRAFLKTLRNCYENASFFERHYEDLSVLIESSNILLETLNVQAILYIAGQMNVPLHLFYSHDLHIECDREQLVKIVCRNLKSEQFGDNFVHPTYPQISDPFESGLSVLDALFCVGAEETRNLLARKEPANLLGKIYNRFKTD